MLWKQPLDLDFLNQQRFHTLNAALGITFTDFGDEYLTATMPVDDNTVQPFRILHGGANVCLAETLGSVASMLCIEDLSKFVPVGLEINANHLRSVKEGGMVTGTCTPVRIGRSIHVWQITIKDQFEQMTCISRLTVSIVEKRG
jgi:1,4-dihydroxy-2-naphthoyl-CoA hydrolase